MYKYIGTRYPFDLSVYFRDTAMLDFATENMTIQFVPMHITHVGYEDVGIQNRSSPTPVDEP